MNLTTITFFQRFEADILSGKKSITIRDKAESHYVPGSIVEVATFEEQRYFCSIKIDKVEAVAFRDLTRFHATQENMSLDELQDVIRQIYPNTDALFVIYFSLREHEPFV